jgi:hypothetical protein
MDNIDLFYKLLMLEDLKPRQKTVKEIIYESVLQNKRLLSYAKYEEIWYVIGWTENIYIHYRIKTVGTHYRIFYFFDSRRLPPEFNPVTQSVDIGLNPEFWSPG